MVCGPKNASDSNTVPDTRRATRSQEATFFSMTLTLSYLTTQGGLRQDIRGSSHDGLLLVRSSRHAQVKQGARQVWP